jgi:RNA polymerase sigma-70 factor (ECF subfamily)
VISGTPTLWSDPNALPGPAGGEGEASDLARWFAEEVRPYEAKLRGYLRRRFPTISDIDDIVQETYVRLFRERRAGKTFEARSYLFPVARNVAIDIFRRSRTVAIGGIGEIERLGTLDEGPDAAKSTSDGQELELLREAIQSLPARCREVFSLRRLGGLTHREIAQKLGISENTVDAHLCQAIFRCRQYFVSRGVSCGRAQSAARVATTRGK